MAKPRRSRRETRYQRIHRLMKDGACGLLPFDFSCPCPKRSGPEDPHPDHPGLVGFLTCRGCTYNTDIYFNGRVCTHPNARRVAAKRLEAQACISRPREVKRKKKESKPTINEQTATTHNTWGEIEAPRIFTEVTTLPVK